MIQALVNLVGNLQCFNRERLLHMFTIVESLEHRRNCLVFLTWVEELIISVDEVHANFFSNEYVLEDP